MKDSHYTPEVLANRLLSFAPKYNVQSVVDFCVGNGALLHAAMNKYEDASFFGIDLSFEAIKDLKRNHPNWILSVADFTLSKSRQKTLVYKTKSCNYDLILMNPPFSCRGGKSFTVSLNGVDFKVSTAMLFIVEALKFLAPKGVLLAILPAAVATSIKDREVWSFLNEKFDLKVIEPSLKNQFSDCSPRVSLVRIRSRVGRQKNSHFVEPLLNPVGYEFFRGKLSVHRSVLLSEGGSFFLHTTNVKENRIVGLYRKLNYNNSMVKGPGLLVPRVGQPSTGKLVVISDDHCFVLSDCLILVKTKTLLDARNLLERLIKDWTTYSECYSGTGAKYITLERLSKYLTQV